MLRTAATRGLDPDRVSFAETLRSARRSVTVTPGSFSPDLLVRALVMLEQDLLERLLPVRRLRSQPRVVKRKMSNYLKQTEHRSSPHPTRTALERSSSQDPNPQARNATALGLGLSGGSCLGREVRTRGDLPVSGSYRRRSSGALAPGDLMGDCGRTAQSERWPVKRVPTGSGLIARGRAAAR